VRNVVAGALVALAMEAAVHAQQPSLDTVLARARAYVSDFERQLTGIVAEELYSQDARTPVPARALQTGSREFDQSHRTLKSDLLLVRPLGADRYVAFRDVFEVDGNPVRDREERVSKLFLQPSVSVSAQLQHIIDESARYNIGSVTRNVNTPTLALTFLQPDYASRVTFRRASDRRPAVARQNRGEQPATFSTSTEVWVVEFRETAEPTLIRNPAGKNLKSRGRFWLEPATGRVLMTELFVRDGRLDTTIDVSYQSEPLVGFLVPIEMRERYENRSVGSLIEGVATYGRFRQFQVRVDEKFELPEVR
jgi:hypothetical protein